jgi:Lrp/AsnC family leucine-responsive transcriptional regulator
MPEHLDERDVKILYFLQRDGKSSLKNLSSKVNLSINAVDGRIKKLESQGYIKGYMAILNKKKVDKNVISFIGIKLSDNSWEKYSQFTNHIMQIPEIINCYLISGHFDLLIHTGTRGMDEYTKVLARLTAVDGAGSVCTFMVLNALIDENRLDLTGLLKKFGR